MGSMQEISTACALRIFSQFSSGKSLVGGGRCCVSLSFARSGSEGRPADGCERCLN